MNHHQARLERYQISGASSDIKLSLLLSFIILFAILNFTSISLASIDAQSISKSNYTNLRDRANEALNLIRDWSVRFGRDIHFGTAEVSCTRSILSQYDPMKTDSSKTGSHKASIVSIDWPQKHADIVKTVCNTMNWHKTAVEFIANTSESLAKNHTFEKDLRFDYIDVHRLYSMDENEDSSYPAEDQELDQESSTRTDSDQSEPTIEPAQEEGSQNTGGENSSSDPSNAHMLESLPKPEGLHSEEPSAASSEWQAPIKYLELRRHPNFGDVLINTEESAVHVPVHIYPAEQQVMNDIAWTDQLTQVFRTNFMRNPKLTNQFFASQTGFLRLFPAQKWQVGRNDPDLYDARMRPWYLAGSSSRKDVVILVDSSGSMTGSRRDIARGVVLEILDTLTDNDYFTVLKFSDSVQQVGVPPCKNMRKARQSSTLPSKNTIQKTSTEPQSDGNETGAESFYLLPANGKNIRHIRTNFSIPTSGIANFSNALITAFEVLQNYQRDDNIGSQCNQAIMLITDGSPSDFEDIFNRYNYPNAPVRVFTYLIGRDAGDQAHTKMMACHNRGYYTHVINLAEVRETVQQYIPVMARPLVLNGTHPITWTSAYGELTYQILTDWIWESKRREGARAAWANSGLSSSNGNSSSGFVPDIKIQSSDFLTNTGPFIANNNPMIDEIANYGPPNELLESFDLFGYQTNPECFWETHRNDLLTTVVQPVYDRKNESVITEKFLVKNTWVVKETVMRTARLLGVAAADMKINDIIALAPSHQLGPNGYAIMLTNNGFAMHHPDLRSILEPFSSELSDKNSRILKPFFSSVDLSQVEHIQDSDEEMLELRKGAVSGLTGWRDLNIKRAFDCQKRVQLRKQMFYYKPLSIYPFSFIVAIPQPYGSHKVEAQIDVIGSSLRERLTNYFTNSNYDLWNIHPDYQYCDGPSNNTITSLLSMLQQVESGNSDNFQWKPQESSQAPISMPNRIVCDKELVQSLLYDAVATFGFSESCTPSTSSDESNLLEMFGVRFSFIATRSGLTRVRLFDPNNQIVKLEMLAFAKHHARAIDETFYSRTVDFNMLVNDTATVIQVPFNTHEKIRMILKSKDLTSHQSQNSQSEIAEDMSSSDDTHGLQVSEMNFLEKLKLLANNSIHAIATQSLIISEGSQRAVVGVSGTFYDYPTFVLRFFSLTEQKFDSHSEMNDIKSNADIPSAIKCGQTEDSIDCILIDNNGYIIVSEQLDFIGRHLRAYEPRLFDRLLKSKVFREVNITDYQAVCMRYEDKQQSQSSSHGLNPLRAYKLIAAFSQNFLESLSSAWTILLTLCSLFQPSESIQSPLKPTSPPSLALLPNKTYLRPCKKIITLYEMNPPISTGSSLDTSDLFQNECGCDVWYVYEYVPFTNLIMLIVDSGTSGGTCQECERNPNLSPGLSPEEIRAADEEQVCSNIERESKMYRKRLNSCFSEHPDEEKIKICGAAGRLTVAYLPLVASIAVLLSIYLTKYG